MHQSSPGSWLESCAGRPSRDQQAAVALRRSSECTARCYRRGFTRYEAGWGELACANKHGRERVGGERGGVLLRAEDEASVRDDLGQSVVLALRIAKDLVFVPQRRMSGRALFGEEEALDGAVRCVHLRHSAQDGLGRERLIAFNQHKIAWPKEPPLSAARRSQGRIRTRMADSCHFGCWWSAVDKCAVLMLSECFDRSRRGTHLDACRSDRQLSNALWRRAGYV
jgi:hypothetical protein